MNYFLSGAVFIAAIISALFFLRYWRDSGERFFIFFSLAFVLLGIERLPLLLFVGDKDTHASVYLIRLCAFILILGAIIDKNRATSLRNDH